MRRTYDFLEDVPCVEPALVARLMETDFPFFCAIDGIFPPQLCIDGNRKTRVRVQGNYQDVEGVSTVKVADFHLDEVVIPHVLGTRSTRPLLSSNATGIACIGLCSSNAISSICGCIYSSRRLHRGERRTTGRGTERVLQQVCCVENLVRRFVWCHVMLDLDQRRTDLRLRENSLEMNGWNWQPGIT